MPSPATPRGTSPGTGPGGYRPAALDVLTLDGERIAAVTGFLVYEPQDVPSGGRQVTGAEVFARFGLPARLP